jgi:N4-gp56 family major capsid protein
MAINLAQKYSSKVDERFKLKSLTASGVNRNYDWVGVNTVTVYSIPTVALGNYDRTASANRYGTPSELQDVKQDLALTKDRSFTFIIDKGNAEEQMGVKNAGKSLAREIDEVIVPEIDAYRINAMALAAIANGGDGSTSATPVAITADNAYEKFLDGTSYLTDNKVPSVGLIAWVSPSFYKFIKLDDTFVKASDLGQKMLINGQVGEIDNVKIIKVPSSYLPTSAAFVIAHPSATVAADKLDSYKIHDDPPGVNGNLVEGRVIYDAFVLTSKVKAVYVHLIA